MSTPQINTNVVLYTLRDGQLKLLLVRRGADPFKSMWALPGGQLQGDEEPEASALRALEEGTGVSGVYVEQLYTFGAPQRDPRRRAIAISYFALIASDRLQLQAAMDAEGVGWFSLHELPQLAFDHAQMVTVARQRLAAKLAYSTIALQFMPDRFTLSELQEVYETILDEKMDKRNFRKRILAMEQVLETEQVRRSGSHRPARLYRVRDPSTVQIIR
jgi:8-oxo-dGTP diphosphatase